MDMQIKNLIGGVLVLLTANAFAQPSNSSEWPSQVSRCANASRIVTGAFERYPDNKEARDGLIERVAKDLQTTKNLGAAQTPTDVEMFITQASGETLLGIGTRPSSSAQARDWFIAQTAATCALKVTEAKYR